jgi:ribosomal protein L16 Arg81 hydroxylase
MSLLLHELQVNMMTGTPKMSELTPYLPVQYADLNPGDMLYNPDWQWHTIQNFEGLSIGVPIREVNMSLSFQNNFQYTSIVMANKLMDKFGVDIGGYPPV